MLTFFDSPPVYPVSRLQILVAYLVFEQAVYSLVDRTSCCYICHSPKNKCILWTCLSGIVLDGMFDHSSIVIGFCCIDSQICCLQTFFKVSILFPA